MKQCLVDSCNCNVFGKGYCKHHQYLRTDKPNKGINRAVEPRSPIKPYKVSAKAKDGLTTKKELLYQWGLKSQRELFDHVWNTRDHVCCFTGEDLTKTNQFFWSWQFMHILPKSTYPLWKFNPDNIVLGFPEFHTAADNFTEKERLLHPDWNFDLFQEMQQKQKERYFLFLSQNML
jgi:hypothetical protein